MTTSVFSFDFSRTVVAVAAGAVCMAALAQADITQTTVSAGLGAVSGSSADRALFGQYIGLRGDRNAVGMLSVDYSLRNQEAGKWVDFQGVNLLGQTRELNLVWNNPGSWKLAADYGELVRYDPNTIHNPSTKAA